MSIRRLFPLLITIGMLLAGCAGATPTPTATSVSTATNLPTSAPAMTATTPATSTPAAIATAAAQDLVPNEQINAKTEARLRLADYAVDGPNVDLIINGAIAVNGGHAQVNMPAGYVDGYLYLMPGTYSVAVVPTGLGLTQALAGPLDVTVAAGHRYTLAMMGQTTDPSLKAVLIDETAAMLKAGIVPTDSVRIWVNNLAGGTSIDIQGGGSSADTQVAYGGYAAVAYPAGSFPFKVQLAGPDAAYPVYDQNFNAPGTTDMIGFVGTWGQNSDWKDGQLASELGILDYLQGFSGKNITTDGPESFDILLAAIKTAGLTDLLTTGGPYLFLPPTDEAFKNLPDQQRQAILANPKVLADLIRNHLVAAYVPRGSLAKTPGGPFDRTFTNLLGAPIAIGADYTINGASIAIGSVFLANGTQINPVTQVLLPPSAAALAPATPTATVSDTTPITVTGQLLFGSDRGGNDDIYRMNADGSELVNLTNNPGMDWGPTLSPDGKKIVFSSDRDGNSEVYVMKADGSGQTRLTNNPADDGGPFSWTPDGKKIVFKTNRDGNYQLYEMAADGSGQTNITKSQTDDELSALSPDGTQIVFASDGGIYLIKSDGSQRTRLTDNPGIFPSWSPDGKQIVFNSGRGGSDEVYAINADGSGETRLTNNPASDGQPTWLPDGKHISFESDRDGKPAIYVMNADGSDQTLVPNSTASDGGRVAWLPGAAATTMATVVAAGRIAYVENTDGNADNFREIWVMNADGSGKTRLTNNAYSDAEPALSADGKELAFTSSRDGNTDIFAMMADGTNPINLTHNPADDGAASWSPDGKKIAFVSSRDGNTEIYVMNADGSSVTRLTNNTADDGDPNWSPDGKQIVFLSRQAGNDDIFVMNADGSGQQNLTNDPVNDGGPAWSPDGKKIAFDTDRNQGNYDVYVMNTDGSDQTRLTDNPGNDFWAIWSPDGTAIAFTSDRDGTAQVYVMNADGSGQTRLTDSSNGASWPSWAAAAAAK